MITKQLNVQTDSIASVMFSGGKERHPSPDFLCIRRMLFSRLPYTGLYLLLLLVEMQSSFDESGWC